MLLHTVPTQRFNPKSVFRISRMPLLPILCTELRYPMGAMDSGTELAWGHLGSYLRPGLVYTRTLELVAPVLGHDGLDFGQIKGLIP
jgi:hypothetical protein